MSGTSDIRLTASWIVEVLEAADGRLVAGERARAFPGVSIDSRTVAPGDLFVAIRGERFDGADFAARALQAGAGGIIVPHGRGRGAVGAATTATVPVVIEVDDTTVALQTLARAVRRQSGARVVAITGSAGKTTTKEVAGEFLATRYRVIRNRGNFNNHIGLPLALLDLRERPEMAVVELGMNHAGEVRTLVGIAEPDVRVWTNVGDAHLGFFQSVEAIADAKAEILEGAEPSTLLVANADDDRVVARIGAFAGRVVTFGIERDADVAATAIVDRGVEGTKAQVATPRGPFELTTPLIGRGNLANVLAATAVAVELDIPPAIVAERAAHLRPAAHRGEVVMLPSGITMIDDSYNANPTATKVALAILGGSSWSARRRVAVLGEMLELGDRAVALHEEVGRAAVSAGVDVLVTVGGQAAMAVGTAAITAGLARSHVHHFGTSEEAAAAIGTLVHAGDLVLVKGSHGVRTDVVVDRLKAERAGRG